MEGPSKPPALDLLERPTWARLECDWIRASLRKLREVLRAPTPLERHLRLVGIANQAVYMVRDDPLWKCQERWGGAEGGCLLHLLVQSRLRAEGEGNGGFSGLLLALDRRARGCQNAEALTAAYLAALAEVADDAGVHDLAAQILYEGFPLPMDRFLVDTLVRAGWSFEHVPFETVTQAQAQADDPKERGGPENLINHLARLVGWADAFPRWYFNQGGWEPIDFIGIPEGTVFRVSRMVRMVEGYPVPMGAGPGYAEARRKIVAGDPVRVRADGVAEDLVIVPKIFPRRRALVAPEGFLRVKVPIVEAPVADTNPPVH